MALFVLFLGLLLFAARTTAEQQLVLALEDNFDDFNLSLWKHELTVGGGGNWEFQYYTNNRSNSYAEDGLLHIRPTLLADETGDDFVRGGRLDIWGASPADLCTGNAFYGCERDSQASGTYLNPIKSARIRTAESFSFTYGKVEVRAKLPRGDWLWPAIWMLPTDNQYGGWPASGEIDIMESRGNSPDYSPGGINRVGSTLHWGPHYTQNRFQLTHADKLGEDFSMDFHTYGFIWNETYIGSYLDTEDNVALSVSTEDQSFWERGGWGNTWDNPWRGRGPNAPFDRRYYLIINLAVGGTTGYFPDGFGKPWTNGQDHAINSFYDDKDTWLPTWDQTFQIDSVKVWTYEVMSTGPNQTPVPVSASLSSFLPTPTTITTAMSSAIGSIVVLAHILTAYMGTLITCLLLATFLLQILL